MSSFSNLLLIYLKISSAKIDVKGESVENRSKIY